MVHRDTAVNGRDAGPDPRRQRACPCSRRCGPGDAGLVTVAGRDVDTWQQFMINVGTRADRDTEIGVLRDGKQFTVRVMPAPPWP